MQIRSMLSTMLCLAFIASLAVSQTEQTAKRMAKGKTVGEDEVVSFKADVSFANAISSLAELSKKLEDKVLIDRSSAKDKDRQIGINIDAMYWKDALELILRSNQLWYNDYPEYREIVSLEDVGKSSQGTQTNVGARTDAARLAGPTGTPQVGLPSPQNTVVPVDSGEIYAKLREITISSIFFEVNQTKLAQSGTRISIFRGRDLNLGVQFDGTAKMDNPIFGATVNPTNPKMVVNVSAAIQMMESYQLGEVLARPQISVRANSSSRIQVGQAFSTREKDFSGNTVEKFYETGTILSVSPRVFKVGDLEFIDLRYSIERSTPQVGDLTVFVNKSIASGALTLLNGEESFVGGMFSNEETTVREGVPFLKDLPWWVFGLRYLFGYDSKLLNRKELIVLLKADMVPFIEERALKPIRKDVMQDKIRENQQEYDRRTATKKN